ncbi:MAG: hypothetical protein MJE68_16655, partial [Proteobacteria bacterium]|nr:hypothetical protein [Pseudomonadota bacterium]
MTCDFSGYKYHNCDHDITLKIPDGAIPPGMVIHVEVAVALYGPFQFPDGLCPISPILWLCIQENVELRKPIHIMLPHFLTDLNVGIQFAKADHKQYTTDEFGKNHYVFQPLETAFTAHKEKNQNYGILSTQHCCFLCIIAEDPQISHDIALKAGYYLWCIEKPSSHSLVSRTRDTLHLCVTFCLPTCRAVSIQYNGYWDKPFSQFIVTKFS